MVHQSPSGTPLITNAIATNSPKGSSSPKRSTSPKRESIPIMNDDAYKQQHREEARKKLNGETDSKNDLEKVLKKGDEAKGKRGQ
uniref:Uncharacterized protein n=1 Tax=Ditylenchus dipsaci TaxID=166011 RepID=A0A915CVH2_9BILA